MIKVLKMFLIILFGFVGNKGSSNNVRQNKKNYVPIAKS